MPIQLWWDSWPRTSWAPTITPTGAAVAASADENGAWFDYTFTNLATGSVETKHSWMVIHDGITFGSGWYEEGPRKTNAPAYTEAVVQQAINLYEAVGLEDTVAYYNTEESVDGQWYAFIVDGESGFTIAHHNPVLREGIPACGWIRQATSMAMTCWGLPKPGVGWST